MPKYNVHLYREMRLFFPGIEAATPGEAARIVDEKATDEATTIDDCEGFSHAALVDLVGDEDFSESVTIDLDPVKTAAQELYDALNALEDAGYLDDIYQPTANKCRAALVKARRETLKEAV